MERINQHASTTFVSLAEQFRTAFMENDPTSDEVAAKQKEVDAKWRVYCKNRALLPEALPKIKEFCESLRKEYEAELNAVIEVTK